MSELRRSTLTVDPDYQPGVIAPPSVPPPAAPQPTPTQPGTLSLPATDPSGAMLYAGSGGPLGALPPAPAGGFLQAVGGDISDVARGIYAAGPGTLEQFWTGQLQPGTPEAAQATANTALTYGTLASPFGYAMAPEGEAVAGMFGRRRPPAEPPAGELPAQPRSPEELDWLSRQQGYITSTWGPGGAFGNVEEAAASYRQNFGGREMPDWLRYDWAQPRSTPAAPSLHEQIQSAYQTAFGVPMEESLQAALSNISTPGWQEGYLERLQDHIREHGPSQYPQSPAPGPLRGLSVAEMAPEAQPGLTPPSRVPQGQSWIDAARQAQGIPEGPTGLTSRPNTPEWWRERAARYREMGLEQTARAAEDHAAEVARRDQHQDLSERQRRSMETQRNLAQLREQSGRPAPSTTGLRLERAAERHPYIDTWDINNAAGEKVGYVHISQKKSYGPVTVGRGTEYPKGTKHLNIEMISSYVRQPKGAWEGAGLSPQYGSFGPTEMKQLLRELRKHYKEGKTDPPVYVDGLRVGGARRQADARGYLSHKIPLQSGIPLPPIPLDASDEEIDRIVNEATAGQGQQ